MIYYIHGNKYQITVFREKEVKEMEQKKITKIVKSYKYDGYCLVYVDGSDKFYKRMCHEKTFGKFAGKILVNFGTDVYSFTWDYDNQAQDITYVGNYKEDSTIYGNKYTKTALEKAKTTETDKAIASIEEPEPIIIPEYNDGIVRHKKFNTILSCIKENVPVYLAGPAGSGKNHALEQIAKDLELDFYFTNSVQQEYKITGFTDAGGIYHETEFYKAFKNGGLFFLDEMDASIPEVLVLLNAAIANGYFEFPNGKITANENFRVVAAGNTVGSGADESYTGRMVLDQATLDRFVIIEFDYDENIEKLLAKGDIDLVNFVHDLRNKAKETGIRATFSYRCITMIAKLNSKMELDEIIAIAIIKGLDKDTAKTLAPMGYTKYHQSYRRVCA